MSPLVEVLDVSLCEFDPQQIHGRGIDRPSAGDSSETFSLDITGWVLGRRSVKKVQIIHRGKCLWRAPNARRRRTDVAATFPDVPEAEKSGFRAAIGTLRLPPEFELTFRAPFGGGEGVTLGTLRGRRARLRLEREPRIQPLVLTAFGRSGTTAVTRMLSSLPSIVAWDVFSREPTVAAYWMQILTALAEPGSYRRQTMHLATVGNWFLGSEDSSPVPYSDEVDQLIGVSGVEALAAFCESRVQTFYERVANEGNGSQVRYFVEKYHPGGAPEVLWDVYPQAKEVILVRDFRDMAASMLAFGVRRDRQFFGRQAYDSDAEFFAGMGKGVSWLVGRRQSTLGSSFVLRYEDLVRRPGDILPALLRHLDIEASEEAITTLHDAFFSRTQATEAHRTTTDAEASIGRWRRDFDAELGSACTEAFRPALEAFGYLPE